MKIIFEYVQKKGRAEPKGYVYLCICNGQWGTIGKEEGREEGKGLGKAEHEAHGKQGT